METDWDFIIKLDEDLLKGGVIINESVAELIRNVDICYVNEAYFATIVTAFAVIETLLKSDSISEKHLYQLINENNFTDSELKELNNLRQARNAIMHNITEVNEDEILMDYSQFKIEYKEISKKAIIMMRRLLYRDQFV